jgi:Gpi18-like mannosyltransferase
MKNKHLLFLIVIVGIYLALCVSTFFLNGYISDIVMQQNWGQIALKEGFQNLYLNYYIDYPPLGIYVFWFNALISNFFTSNQHLFLLASLFVSKIIPTLVGLLSGIIIYLYVKKENRERTFIVILMYFLNLSLIYDTAYWGQVDSLHTLLMLITTIFLVRKKYLASSIFMTLAVLTKFQSIAILPVFAISLLKDCNYKKIFKIVGVNFMVVLFVLWPYIPNALVNIFKVYFNSIDLYPHATMNAYNLWFLFSRELNWVESLGDQFIFWGVSLKFIGLFLLGTYTLLVVYQLIKDHSVDKIILASASLTLAFFILPTQIHERYLFPFFAIFLLIAYKNIKYLSVYLILSATYLLNLMIVLPFPVGTYHINIFSFLQWCLNKLADVFSFLNMAIIISIINVLVFVYFSKIGIFENLIINLKKDFVKLMHNKPKGS